MSIKLIVSDMDGCITEGRGKVVDPFWFNKIAEYNLNHDKDSNPPVTVCTGRSHPYVEAMIKVICGSEPGICEHGAYICDNAKDKIVVNPLITPQVSRAIQELRMKILDHIPRWDVQFEICKEYCISLRVPENGNCEEAYNNIKNLVPREFFNIVYDTYSVNITPLNVDKGNGIKLLSEYTGVELKDMAAIGDSAMDLSFMNLVGFKACPANAAPAVKEVADYVSPYSFTQGVWDIICYINKSYNKFI